jgi:predicted nucleic acid-binding Zn ribbon protein
MKHIYCKICKKILKYGKKFCSYKCYGVFQQKRVVIICEICNRKKAIPLSQAKVGGRCCSRKCHFIYQSKRKQISGKKHHAWKIGKTNSLGYILIRKPTHHNAMKSGYILEHRLIMAKKLNRYLMRTEVVHHIDMNSSNNDIHNLSSFLF